MWTNTNGFGSKSRLALVALGALVAACGAADGEEITAESSDEIIGGSADTAHPAVGHIRFDVVRESGEVLTSGCTGTLISPTVVLTAGHCVSLAAARVGVKDAKAVQNWRVSFAANVKGASDASYVKAKSAHAYPGYDGSVIGDQSDIAVVVLERAQSIAPIAFNTKALGSDLVGKAVTNVGYGHTLAAGSFKSGGNERRNVVTVSLNAIKTNTIATGARGRTTCNGDSGGPALMNLDGRETIVATTSYGPGDCGGASHSARVDRVWQDFLSKYVSAPAAPSKPAPAPSSPPSTTPPPTGGSSYTCSIDGATYSCPDKASLDKCAGFDLGACFSACGADFACFSDCQAKAAAAPRDPSGCTRK